MSLDVVASKILFLGPKSPDEKVEGAAGEEDIPF